MKIRKAGAGEPGRGRRKEVRRGAGATGKGAGGATQAPDPIGGRKTSAAGRTLPGGDLLLRRDLLDAVLEQCRHAVVVCDEKGTIVRASPEAARLCPGSPEGAPFEDAFPLVPAKGKKSRGGNPDASGKGGRLPVSIGPVLGGEEIRDLEADLVHGRNGPRAVIVDAVPVRRRGARGGGCVVTLADAANHDRKRTELRRVREELRRTREERDDVIRERTRELSILNQELYTEIRERMQAEIEARQSEARFRTLVETLPVAILVVQDGRIVFRNRVHDELFEAAQAGAALRESLSVHPEDAGRIEEFIAVLDAGKPSLPTATFRILPGGDPLEEKVRWVLCQGSPILHRERRAHLIAATDVTRSKELEQIVLVREKLTTLGIIAAGIAHEIRNPLSGMNIYLSALAHLCDHSDRMDPETKERIEVISGQLSRASEKISSVIRGIMDFTRPSPLAMTSLDLNETVEAAVRMCASTIRMQKVELATSLPPVLPPCRGDRMLIGQVLVNLITNALQAMEGEGGAKKLKIATAEKDGMALLRVADSGEGVPRHLREQIFDPFFTTRKKGYGIGLSFCRRVVEDHRGVMSVHTSEWGGAEFRITIPLAEEEAAP